MKQKIKQEVKQKIKQEVKQNNNQKIDQKTKDFLIELIGCAVFSMALLALFYLYIINNY